MHDFVERLDFASAKQFLKDEITPELWASQSKPNTRESIIASMRDYMDFALEKARDHRGISAGRSLDHFRAWLWLLEDEETLAFLDDEKNYPQYGAPCLKKICEVYDFKEYAEQFEGSLGNMARGESCTNGCEEGCG